jgi:hypothetical protein
LLSFSLQLHVQGLPLVKGDRPSSPLRTLNHCYFVFGTVYSKLLSLCIFGFCGMLRLGCMDHGF